MIILSGTHQVKFSRLQLARPFAEDRGKRCFDRQGQGP